MTNDENTQNTQIQAHELLFGVRRSIQYHNRRKGFYNQFNLLTNAFAIIGGSGMALQMLQQTNNAWAATASGMFIVITSTVNLVVNTTHKANQHHNIAQQFIALEKQIITAQQPIININQWQSTKLTIEANEPPILQVLDTICHNDLLRRMGYNDSFQVQVSFIQRLLSNIIDITPHKLKAPNQVI